MTLTLLKGDTVQILEKNARNYKNVQNDSKIFHKTFRKSCLLFLTNRIVDSVETLESPFIQKITT